MALYLLMRAMEMVYRSGVERGQLPTSDHSHLLLTTPYILIAFYMYFNYPDALDSSFFPFIPNMFKWAVQENEQKFLGILRQIK
mmetsp:Transcript_13748/g.13458  ORF Transcript_13748/g.13458 Transcript_13748/m.13458 type:complete len:84 (-) Transcript_13748:39-290(-)